MTRNISRYFTLLLGFALLGACSDHEELSAPTGQPEDTQTMSLALKGTPAKAPAAVGTANPSADILRVFQFGTDGLFSQTAMDAYDPEDISLVKGTTRGLYCVQGIEVEAPEGISEEAFALSQMASPAGADSAPLFYSAWTSVEPDRMGYELTMKRSIARIDLDASDADMEISKVTVDDAPAASYVFVTEAGKLDAPTTSYSISYAAAPTGIDKGIFTIFESAKPVHVTIHGIVDGAETTVQAEIESVERNKVYTLRVYNRNATVKAAFSVADWEDGGVIEGHTEMSDGLHIDLASSTIPAEVTVDAVRNIIEVPSTGAQGMKLVFLSDLRVDIDTIHFAGERVAVDSIKEKHVGIRAGKAINTPAGVMTAIDVNVAAQLKGRPGYEIRMELSKPSMNVSCDDLTIRVAESPYQLQTVMMAGAEWMCFNATTKELSDQIYAEPGMSVEEYYQEHWISTIGNFFQYGRVMAWDPWNRSDPALNTLDPDTPWATPECMPLPEGYHVATGAEWLSLIPSGVTFPSTYTAGNGEKLKGEVVELPGTLTDSPCTPANNAKLRKRYIRIESLETGNVLIFPVCGMKGASKDLYPGGGKNLDTRAVYWNSNERGVWLINMTTTADGQLGANPMSDKWNINGFVALRGVKDK